jgi:DNA-binding NarL/FixJ family response regulator
LSKIKASVLVVDDFEPFRVMVCALLRERLGLWIIDEAMDGLEAVEKARIFQPDLILMDIGLPKLNGLEAAQQIRQVAPQSKIIFVTQEVSRDVVQEAVGLGALGYVTKGKVESELLKAIDAVRQGNQFIGSGLA